MSSRSGSVPATQRLFRKHALTVIVVSIAVALAFRIVQSQVRPDSIGAERDPSLEAGVDAVVLFLCLALVLAFAKPFGVRRSVDYPVRVQLAAVAWACWATGVVVGIAVLVVSHQPIQRGSVITAVFGGVMLGFRLMYWLALATVTVVALDLGRETMGRSSRDV